jgi:hypothetical protein
MTELDELGMDLMMIDNRKKKPRSVAMPWCPVGSVRAR